jgi:hypothetical protein
VVSDNIEVLQGVEALNTIATHRTIANWAGCT